MMWSKNCWQYDSVAPPGSFYCGCHGLNAFLSCEHIITFDRTTCCVGISSNSIVFTFSALLPHPNLDRGQLHPSASPHRTSKSNAPLHPSQTAPLPCTSPPTHSIATEHATVTEKQPATAATSRETPSQMNATSSLPPLRMSAYPYRSRLASGRRLACSRPMNLKCPP